MAQAVADLHDPPEAPAASPDNTDEVLSQLAGEEIDRLLAEADKSPPSPAPAPQAPAPDVAAATDPKPTSLDESQVSAQIDQLFSELQKEGKPPQPPAADAPPTEEPAAKEAAAAPPQIPPTEGAERAALLQAAGFDANAPAPTAPAPADTSAPAPQQQATPPPAASPADPAAAERAAVLTAAGFETGQNADAPSADGPLPVFLKPLEWMNAPLRHCSDGVRQAMGRAAIVTLINAILVLSYVLIFRRH